MAATRHTGFFIRVRFEARQVQATKHDREDKDFALYDKMLTTDVQEKRLSHHVEVAKQTA